jgi:hypothetical protein
MTEELEKLQPSELIHRALAGAGEGVSGFAKSSIGNLGLLALVPLIRKGRIAPEGLPEKFKTQSSEELADLAHRMSMAGGRDPSKGKQLQIEFNKEPGKASLFMESSAKGRAPRDMLRVSKGVSPETLAHEVGHATSGTKAGRFLRSISRYARSKPARFLPSLLALSGAIGPKDQEEPHLLAKAAPLIGGAQLASILGEETRANIRGIKILEKLRYAMPFKKKLKMFLPTSTYLGKAGLLVGAPLGILKGITEYNKAQKAGRPMTLQNLLAAHPSQIAATPPLEEVKQDWAGRLGR